VKLTNVAALTDGGVVRYGPRQPYHVHRAYEEKRGRGGCRSYPGASPEPLRG